MSARRRIATNIRALLIAAETNQAEAAESMGVSKPWLSDLMNEKIGSFDKLDTVAAYLGCDVAFLLFPPEIVMRDLARHTSRDTTPRTALLPKGGDHDPAAGISGEAIPTEDELLDSLDHLVDLIRRFRLARRGPRGPEPQKPGDRP